MFACATNSSSPVFVVVNVSFNTLKAFVGSVPAMYSSRLLMPSPSASAVATADADGDGMSNRDEYIAGTDPTNALSVLKLTLTTTNTGLLEFVAQANIGYTVQYRTNLSSALWNNVTSISAQPL